MLMVQKFTFFSEKGVNFFLLFTKFFPQCYKLPCYLEWIQKLNVKLLKKSGLAAIMGLLAFSVFASNIANGVTNPFTAQNLVTFTMESPSAAKVNVAKAKPKLNPSAAKVKINNKVKNTAVAY
jgi:hypothetical protein